MTLHRKKRCTFCFWKSYCHQINDHLSFCDDQNVVRFNSREFKIREMVKRKVSKDMRRQNLSAHTIVGLRSLLDGVVHYSQLSMLGHQSEFVRRLVNGFVDGTMIDLAFAPNTIEAVVSFIRYHHYVHDVTEEIYFDREFAENIVHPLDKFDLEWVGVLLGIEMLLRVFVNNMAMTYGDDFTLEEFRDDLGLGVGPLTSDQVVVLRRLEDAWF